MDNSSNNNETRWSQRTPVNLDIDLLFQGYEYTGCRTRDIGLGGMFVEFKQADMPNNAEVEIVVRLFMDGNKKCHRFRATVAHASNGGYGLAFQDFDAESYRVVQDIIKLKVPDEAIH